MNKRKLSYFEKTKAAVIFGGAGKEHNVSVMSAVSFISEANKLGIPILPIYINERGAWFIFTGDVESLSKDSVPKSSDLCETYPIRLCDRSGFSVCGETVSISSAFVLLHGDRGEDGEIQGVLTASGIPFFGENVFASAVASDKEAAKLFASSLGIPTARSVTLTSDTDISDLIAISESQIGYPCFIKPTALGSSIGVGRADSRDELRHRFEEAFRSSVRVLCEEAFCNKRELECAYFAISNKVLVTAPGEVFSDGFYDYTSKYDIPKKTVCKAKVKEEISEKIREYTARLARAMDIRHMARFDYFLLPDEKIIFNEVNTIPGMTKDSLYPKMLSAAGISFSEFVKFVLGGAPW